MVVRLAGHDAAGADEHLDALDDDHGCGEQQEGILDRQGVQVPVAGVGLQPGPQQGPAGDQGDDQDDPEP